MIANTPQARAKSKLTPIRQTDGGAQSQQRRTGETQRGMARGKRNELTEMNRPGGDVATVRSRKIRRCPHGFDPFPKREGRKKTNKRKGNVAKIPMDQLVSNNNDARRDAPSRSHPVTTTYTSHPDQANKTDDVYAPESSPTPLQRPSANKKQGDLETTR